MGENRGISFFKLGKYHRMEKGFNYVKLQLEFNTHTVIGWSDIVWSKLFFKLMM